MLRLGGAAGGQQLEAHIGSAKEAARRGQLSEGTLLCTCKWEYEGGVESGSVVVRVAQPVQAARVYNIGINISWG